MGFTIAFAMGLIVFTLAVIRVMESFFERRRTSVSVLLISGLPLLFSAIAFSFWLSAPPIIIMSTQLLAFFLITLNYESFMGKRLAVVGIIFILLNVIDNSFSLFFTFFPAIIADKLVVLLIGLVLKILFFFFTAFLIKRLTVHKKLVDYPAIWTPSLMISGSVIVLGMLYLSEISYIREIWIVLMWYAALFLVFYLSCNLSAIFEEKLKSTVHLQEKEYYSAQCQLMQESVESVKAIRHDMKLHLAALKEYTAENKAAADYLNSLLDDIGESEIYSDTGNIAFDSIINYKLRDARKDNIKLDLRMSVPPVLNVEVADIAAILGNLLVNALEAVARVNEKTIKLDIEYGKGGLFIRIENPFSGKIKYLNETSGEEKKIASIKGSGEHGYGLKNIRKSIEKYNGYMKITTTDQVFSAGVFLYVDDM